jgi:lipid-A-disaccharide synthase
MSVAGEQVPAPEGRRRAFIVAGEPSGDALAAPLAMALKRLDPELEIRGVCGPRMRAAGVIPWADVADLSVMGVAEVVGTLGGIRRLYRRIVAELESDRAPDLLVLVDFPEFNLRLARAAKRRGVRVLYYVSPQIWAWRRGRVREVRDRVDAMIVVFPFEERFYESHGVRARFFGHPLAESVRATRMAADTRARYGLDPTRPLVALLPGSRPSEIRRHLPLMLQVAEVERDRAQFAIARAPGLDAELLHRALASTGARVPIVDDDTYNLLAAADVATVVSGTATVECALLGCPPVVVYKTSALTYAIARALVHSRYVAMPNIILDAPVVPELIQGRATVTAIGAELRRFLDDAPYRDRTVARLAEVRDALVRPGAADRAAAYARALLP